MKAATCFCLVIITLLHAHGYGKPTASEVDDLLKDNDNKTVIVRPDSTPGPTTASPSSPPSLINDTAVNAASPTQSQVHLVETMSKAVSSSQLKQETTPTPTTTPTPITVPNNNSVSPSSASISNQTDNLTTASTGKANEPEESTPAIARNVTQEVTSEASKTTAGEALNTTKLLESTTKNKPKLIIEVYNVTEPTSATTTTTTEKTTTPISLSTSTKAEEVAHPAEVTSPAAEEEEAVVVIGNVDSHHSSEAQRLEQDAESAAALLTKHEKHDHPTSRGVFEPGLTAGIMASVFIGVAIFGYIGLIMWRKMLEKRYGNREMLVNEDDFNDVNYMSNFEL